MCIVLPGSSAGRCGPACTSDSDCPTWLTCTAGLCVQQTKCPAGQALQPVVQWNPDPCSSSKPCPLGEYCGPGAQCMYYEACGQCSGGCATCTSNNQCAAGQACTDGACGACTSADQCGPTAQCAATHTTSQCTCSSSSDCATGEACVSGLCAPACTSTSGCSIDQVCVAGVCDSCTSNAQCGPPDDSDAGPLGGGRCESPFCSCFTPANCLPGQGCRQPGRFCGPCQDSFDCATGQACVAGVCGACSTFADCSQEALGASRSPTGFACIGGVCSACTANSQCGGGMACVSGTCGTCITNAQCGPSGQCGDGFCTCTTATQCAAGQRCGAGVCVSM